MAYSVYFQATVKRDKICLFTAILRSCEYLAFDRTIDAKKNILELFVSPDSEKEFLSLMDYFESKGIVLDLHKLPNRLSTEVV